MTLEMKLKKVSEETFEDGFKDGVKQGMIKQIKSLKEFGIESSKIISKIKEDYNISEEEVKNIYNMPNIIANVINKNQNIFIFLFVLYIFYKIYNKYKYKPTY